ncbi:non-ribosomal peptide synthetase [Serratia rubidaea]|uniref:non-ribosomal peptide synthetase n=1 Tax=Serratia rubidaea TaxID=61652 RepID=UPI001CDAE5DB|nr:non-ribosomal peptide synthetase [Serratia rubidaea]
MVPAAYVHLAALPLTANSKLDRRALPLPEGDAYARQAWAEPQGETEQTLAQLWQALLPGVERVGRHDNFFELGGHSLLAVQLVSRLRQVLAAELSLHEVFSHPTLGALAERVAQSQPTTLSAIVRQPRGESLPLSLAQQRLWFLTQMEGVSESYHIGGAVRLTGELNVQALEQALAALLQRHEALRTLFRLENGVPRQVIIDAPVTPLTYCDLRHAAQDASAAQCAAFSERRFALERELPLRLQLLQTGEQAWLLQMVMHHIAADGWSMGIFLHELSALYNAALAGDNAELAALPVQYADYAVWQRDWLAEGRLDAQLAYWRETLADAPVLLELPLDHPRPAQQSTAGDSVALQLGAELSAQLRALSQRHGVTLYMTLLAGWAVLLSRLSGQEEVVIGTPVAGREREEVEGLIGFFVNTLALRLAPGRCVNVDELLTAVREQVLAAQAHQALPFDQVVEAVQPPRSLAHTPLFQVMFDWQNAPESELNLTGLTAAAQETSLNSVHFDLSLSLQESGGEICGSLNYATALFERQTIERMAGYLRQVLTGMTAETPVAQLPLLDVLQRQQLLYDWNNTARDWPHAQGTCLHQLFEAQARRSPEAIALTDGKTALSYRQLNQRANQQARYLRRRHVPAGGWVLLSMTRSIEMVTAMLAVMKAGAAWIPLDPQTPPQRLQEILHDAEPQLILTQGADAWGGPEGCAPLLTVDALHQLSREEAPENLTEPALHPGLLAYAIFTSGSTGKPKGVMIEHSAIVNYAVSMAQRLALAEGQTSLVLTPLHFDLALTGLYPALLAGATVRLATEDGDPSLWARDLLNIEQLALVKLTPSHLLLLQQALADEDIAGRIGTLVVGGEALKATALAWWRQRAPATRIINHYGPTEATVGCVLGEVAADAAPVPIGRPLDNMRVYILDASGQLLPPGIVGEMYLAGAGIARGYINQPVLTAERFVRDPFAAEPTAKMYRTGDLARWRADGQIEYLGRNDGQLKLRGFRIEPGDIEAALCAFDGIEQVAVTVAGADEKRRRLVAYYVGRYAEATALRQHLMRYVPDYMTPSLFIRLAAFPLTPNGKRDMKALPAPKAEALSDKAWQAPQGEREQRLAEIWAELLAVPLPGRDDNFFELGGHSLLVVSLIERLRQDNLYADVRALFTAPTLSEQARSLSDEHRRIAVPENKIPTDCEHITPEMLTLVSLSQAGIDHIVAQTAGGAANIKDIYPLAPLQEGMLFHHMLDDAEDVYVEAYQLAFADRAGLERFLQALRQVMARHDILRSAIAWDCPDRPVQVVWRQVTLPVRFITLDDDETDAARWFASHYSPREYRMDVRQAPLLHALAAHDHHHARWVLHLLAHHMVLDHTTLDSLAEEIAAIERGELAQLPEPVPFRQFVAHTRLGVSEAEHQAFFSAMLAGIDEPTVPFGIMDVRGSRHDIAASCRLDDRLSQSLRQLARRCGVSAASLMHLAWALVLARLTGRRSVVFGTVLFGRMQGGIQADRALGLFMNTLPLRLDIDAQPLRDRLQQTHELLIELMHHEHAALALAQRCSSVPPQTPLFTSLLNYRYSQQSPHSSDAEAAFEYLNGYERTNYPLTLSIDDLGDAFVLTAQVRDNMDPERICRLMQAALECVLQGMDNMPSLPVGQLDMMSAQERHLAERAWNDTARDHPLTHCLHQLFERQAQDTPQAAAVRQDGASVSYQTLNQRANQLARYLRAQGVGTDVRVALATERSADLLVGLLGILKAGGAWLPLDPAYPAERLRYVLQDAQPLLMLTHSSLRGRLPDTALPVCELDSQWDEIGAYPAHNPDYAPQHPRQLAYVIYTSGSTGRPKGVMVEHGNVVNFLYAMQEQLKLGEHDALLAVTSVSFDISILELFLPLLNGAHIVLATGEQAADAQQLNTLIVEQGVTLMQATPATWRMLLQLPEFALPGGFRLLCGGEALPERLAAELLARTPAVWNLYGPTETTIWSTLSRLTQPLPTIGRPIANTQIYILDDALRLTPAGVAGEICIGGAGVARGYLNRPELTAERFIADPFSRRPGARLYRTGDLGRWRADGTLEYLGRNDTQVKLRGFRIETAEIEAQLAQVDGVQDAVVLLREDSPGERRLAAYYTGEILEAAQLRRAAEAQLPEYMVPAAYVHLTALPLTPNGKLDRRALPLPEGDAYARQAWAAPEGETERTLARLWQALLPGVERVGRHDNFFELGGHSLLAVRLVSRLRQALAAELALSEIFSHPTLSALAARIDQSQPATLSAIARQPRGESLPLSLAQQRLWFLAQMEGVSESYHISGAVRLTGELNVPALEQALAALLQRHEALRTLFKREDGAPRQVIVDVPPDLLRYHDLRDAAPETVEAYGAAMAARRFTLSEELPLRLQLLQIGKQAWLLQVVMHHIAADGWSMGIFLHELSALYNAALAGDNAELAALPVQYADYAVWQRDWLAEGRLDAQLAYWRETLADAPVLLTLPTDYPRPTQQSTAGDSVALTLGTVLSGQLRALSQRHGVTLYMTLLAGWAVLLSRLSGQEEVVIGTPVAGREREEVEGLIGFFVNTLALRLAPGRCVNVDELLTTVRERVLAAQAHQALPFDQVVEAVQPPRSLAHTPLFQVMFDWQNAPEGELNLTGLTTAAQETPRASAQCDLTLSLEERDGEVCGQLNYATSLFERQTIERMAGYLRQVLTGMAAEIPVAQLSLLDDAQRQRLLYGWNDTARPLTTAGVHQQFEAQAARTPDATALEIAPRLIGYGELNEQANRLAHYLRAQGVGPEVRVAVCTADRAAMVLAMLAVLKAGGAYVALDAGYPAERLTFMLQDSAPALLLTDAKTRRLLSATLPQSCMALDLHNDAGIWQQESTENLHTAFDAARLAYVIYTSGSTGRPKGVMIEHAGLQNIVAWHSRTFALTAGSRSSCLAGMGFDACTWEVWPALCCGGTLVMRAEAEDDVKALLHWWQAQRLDVSFLATPLAELAYALGYVNNGVRNILIGGDNLKRLPSVPAGQRLVNNYGPTESTIVATSGTLHAGDALHIGAPIDNTAIYLLDSSLQPVPVGVVGEIYVGGIGVARGYLNQPELTAARFIADRFHPEPNCRMYKTGDLARWRRDGVLEYCGRNDDQVKIRGFRIELGEIEQALLALDTVSDAVVLARETPQGSVQLHAWYCANHPLPLTWLRQELAKTLPQYMLPVAYCPMTAFPLTPNGKLDRRALPAPAAEDFIRNAYSAPQGELECAIGDIWRQLLGMEAVSRYDNFFDLGGHSLLGVRMLALLRERLQRDIPLRELFAAPALSDFARAVAQEGDDALPANITPFRRSGSQTPLFFLHPGLGEIGYVNNLLPGIDEDIPVYGLTAIGFRAGERPLYSLEDIAAAYISAVRQVQPSGPYRLVGWCAGGNIAWEMANQLLRVGEEISFLGLLDAPSVSPVDDSVLSSLLSRLPDALPDDCLRDLQAMAGRGDIRGMLAYCQTQGYFPSELTLEALERILVVQHSLKLAKLAYQLPALPLSVIHFMAKEDPYGAEYMQGWHQVAQQVIEHPVDGNHMSMVELPHALTLAQTLCRRLTVS